MNFKKAYVEDKQTAARTMPQQKIFDSRLVLSGRPKTKLSEKPKFVYIIWTKNNICCPPNETSGFFKQKLIYLKIIVWHRPFQYNIDDL